MKHVESSGLKRRGDEREYCTSFTSIDERHCLDFGLHLSSTVHLWSAWCGIDLGGGILYLVPCLDPCDIHVLLMRSSGTVQVSVRYR